MVHVFYCSTFFSREIFLLEQKLDNSDPSPPHVHWLQLDLQKPLCTQAVLHFLISIITNLREGWPKFRKSSKRGGGYFQSKNFCLKFWTFKQGFLDMKLIQICNMIFQKWGGGGVQRPFRTFPKIHPSSCGHPSLLLWPKHADVKTTSSSPSPSLKSARSATLPTLRLPIWSSLSWEEAVQIAVLYLVVMPFGVYM